MNKNILKKKNLKKLKKKLKHFDKFIIFLDYDGTLAYFNNNPDKATPVPGIKKIISSLAKIDYIKICIISGRNLDDLKNMIEISNVFYAGLHGMEMDNFTYSNIDEEKIMYYENRITDKFKKDIKNNNIYLENKKYVLSIHYNKNYDNLSKLILLLNDLIDHNRYEVMEGRKILELRPKGWDKGKAVRFLVDKIFQKEDVYEIYIGDDTTDEDAFNVIKGTSIYVKNEDSLSSNTNFFLKNPDHVLSFLKKLKGLLLEIK